MSNGISIEGGNQYQNNENRWLITPETNKLTGERISVVPGVDKWPAIVNYGTSDHLNGFGITKSERNTNDYKIIKFYKDLGTGNIVHAYTVINENGTLKYAKDSSNYQLIGYRTIKQSILPWNI